MDECFTPHLNKNRNPIQFLNLRKRRMLPKSTLSKENFFYDETRADIIRIWQKQQIMIRWHTTTVTSWVRPLIHNQTILFALKVWWDGLEEIQKVHLHKKLNSIVLGTHTMPILDLFCWRKCIRQCLLNLKNHETTWQKKIMQLSNPRVISMEYSWETIWRVVIR